MSDIDAAIESLRRTFKQAGPIGVHDDIEALVAAYKEKAAEVDQRIQNEKDMVAALTVEHDAAVSAWKRGYVAAEAHIMKALRESATPKHVRESVLGPEILRLADCIERGEHRPDEHVGASTPAQPTLPSDMRCVCKHRYDDHNRHGCLICNCQVWRTAPAGEPTPPRRMVTPSGEEHDEDPLDHDCKHLYCVAVEPAPGTAQEETDA